MSTKPLTIMLVEDETMLQDVYKLVLEAHNHTVVTADNGKQALEKLESTTPDVILLDMLMPVMDGRQFMKTFKSTDFPATKVIVYSNLSDSAAQAEMLELGVERFVLKSSMTPKDLISLVETTAA